MRSGGSNRSSVRDPARILIVDDEPDITTILSKALVNDGFIVDTFNSPELALSKFKTGYYHLSLLDIRMPGMNGFQLYRKLKEKDPALTVCFMTAFEIYAEESEKVFPQYDIRAFIKKPVGMATLNNIVREVVKSQSGEKG